VYRSLCLAVLLLLAACSRESPSEQRDVQTPPPPPPDKLVEEALAGLRADEPAAFYERALPPAQREDLQGLLRTFGQRVDPDVHAAAVTLLRQVSELMREQRAFILASPYLQPPQGDIGAERWARMARLPEAVTETPLGDAGALSELSLASFPTQAGTLNAFDSSAVSLPAGDSARAKSTAPATR